MPEAPEGFKIAGAVAGIKKSGLDLGLLYSTRPATAAAVFTKNAFTAAPILVTREHLKAASHKVHLAPALAAPNSPTPCSYHSQVSRRRQCCAGRSFC